MCYSPHWLRAAFLAEGEGIALWLLMKHVEGTLGGQRKPFSWETQALVAGSKVGVL